MASLQADKTTPVKEVTNKTEETTHDHQESAAVDQDQDLATKDIEFTATEEETDHDKVPKEVVLPDDIEEDSEVLADHEEDKAALVSPIEEDSKWTEKIEHEDDHEAEDQDDEDDEEL